MKRSRTLVTSDLFWIVRLPVGLVYTVSNQNSIWVRDYPLLFEQIGYHRTPHLCVSHTSK